MQRFNLADAREPFDERVEHELTLCQLGAQRVMFLFGETSPESQRCFDWDLAAELE